MAYLIILFRDYNMLWTQRQKWSLASKSFIMSHHYLLSYTDSPSVSVLFFKILLYTFKTLRGAAPTFLTELISPYVPRRALSLLTNFYWSNQNTSSNWLAWGLSQCARLTSATRFHLRLKGAHLSLFLKLSLRPIFSIFLDFKFLFNYRLW